MNKSQELAIGARLLWHAVRRKHPGYTKTYAIACIQLQTYFGYTL